MNTSDMNTMNTSDSYAPVVAWVITQPSDLYTGTSHFREAFSV